MIEQSMPNRRLLDLYRSKWDGLGTALQSVQDDVSLELKPTNPLLITIANEDDWAAADIRLMFFGQEANGWYEEQDDIDSICLAYKKFFYGDECYKYGGQFWNGISRFLYLLRSRLPNKKVFPIWNNIVKIGKSTEKGFPPDYIYEGIERKHFAVIKAEVDILKPDAVVFFTGPNYDNILVDNFGKVEFKAIKPFEERELSTAIISEMPFAARTYHPNFLWRNDIDGYLNPIIDRLTKPRK